MHELPTILQKSLHSWRGSVRLSQDQATLSQLRVQQSELSIDPEKDTNNSQLILHPTASSHHLRTQAMQFAGDVVTSPTQDRPQAWAQNTQQAAEETNATTRQLRSRRPTDTDPSAHRNAQDPTPLTPPAFYESIGMNAPSNDGTPPKSLEAMHGLYSHICKRERLVERKYRAYDAIATIFLIAQILLSAIFIVLGALNTDHHIAIAVLGAVGTLITGTLAMMKGQGLPNRLRMERDELKKVIFEADELYWDVGAGKQVTYADVKKVREDYLNVVEDAAKNHPDTWNTSTTTDGLGSQSNSGSKSTPWTKLSAKQMLPERIV